MIDDNEKKKSGGLVLTRKENEMVIIGDGLIVVQVLKIKGTTVSLRFMGPKEISIHRSEVHDLIVASKNKPA